MNEVPRTVEVPPPPTLAPSRGLPLLVLGWPPFIVGFVLMGLPNAPQAVRIVGGAFVFLGLGLQVWTALRARMSQVPALQTGPYVLVPTTGTFRQMGYLKLPSKEWRTVNVFAGGDALDLVGNQLSGGASAMVPRSQLVAVRPRRVSVDGAEWWGIAIERVDKPEDLEFGIRDDQVDVAAAQQRAIAVAANLTAAMRLGADPS